MKRVLIFFPEKCIGCRLCEMACSMAKENEFNPRKSRIRVVSDFYKGIDHVIYCKQCEKPPCLHACPVNAIEQDKMLKTVVINEKKCIGCGVCIDACPFGAIFISDNIAKKCDLCNGGSPECIKYCKYGALTFKTIDFLVFDKWSRYGEATKPSESVLKKFYTEKVELKWKLMPY